MPSTADGTCAVRDAIDAAPNVRASTSIVRLDRHFSRSRAVLPRSQIEGSEGVVVCGSAGQVTAVRFAWFTWVAWVRASEGPGMVELPSGTVTFLFTDLEGSTRLWEEHREVMLGALARHDEIVQAAIAEHDGEIVKPTGDGFHAVFANAACAVAAAVDAQQALSDEVWGEPGALRVRMGIHSGAAEVRDGDYPGPTVNRAARVMSVANGGQVVVSQVTADLVRDELPAGVGLLDLGEYILRDFSRPERVFQVTATGIPSVFPPLRSVDRRRGNLASRLSSFVGREQELVQVRDALLQSRLVTLTGVGGVGKTRLGVQVATEIQDRFADGAWLCELATAGDADAMMQIVASALGVVQRPGMSLGASMVEFARAKQMLVVLDNCEHLVEPAMRLSRVFLDACPEVRVLATSREALGIEGEQVRPVRSLRENDAQSLFAARATLAGPDFVLNDSNVEAVSEICRRLDGMPLAIELAAARTTAMHPSEIAAHLDERFRLLTGGPRTAIERHQTLRSTVEWSYSLLTPAEQLVFDRLGVFVGSFDAPAAAAVVALGDVVSWGILDELTSLVAKSMIVTSPGPDDTTRYQLLETLRAYAREHLDAAGETDHWRRRHAEHYTALAEQLEPALISPDELRWRRRFRAEVDNLRAAVGWALDSTRRADRHYAVRIVTALALQISPEVHEWAERTRHGAPLSTPEARSAILGVAAMHAQTHFDVETARALGEQAINEGPHSDGGGFVGGAFALSWALNATGAFEQAMDVVARAHDTLDHSNVRSADYCNAILYLWEATSAHFAHDRPRANLAAELAMAAARRQRQPTLLSFALTEFARARRSDDPATALAAFEESAELIHAGADGNLDVALAGAAQLRANTDPRTAVEYLQEGLIAGRDRGFMGTISLALTDTEQTMLELGDPEAAATIHGWLHQFESRDTDPRPHEHELVTDLTERLGATAYDTATARGAAMETNQLIEHILRDADRLLVQHNDG